MRRHLVILAVIIGLAIALLSLLFLNVSFFPPLASQQGEAIDDSTKLLFAIAAGILALIVGILLYSVVRFRRKAGDTSDGLPIKDNIWLVGAFFFIPLALVLWSASFGAIKLNEVQEASGSHDDELEVRVTAVQWVWIFEFPDLGVTAGELVLPVNRPVLFRLTSRDVVHSFWVPEWRPKIDAVPGMETQLRITPTKLGDYKARCAELCGIGHTAMRGPVKVTTEEEFNRWVDSLAQSPARGGPDGADQRDSNLTGLRGQR